MCKNINGFCKKNKIFIQIKNNKKMSSRTFHLRRGMMVPRKGVAFSGMGFAPLSVRKHRISHVIGKGSGELLLSPELGTSSLGSGFGVKTPSRELMSGLERLSLKRSVGGQKSKQNIRF